jgi:tetratricopeptide (TPR) repeat protein
MNQKFNFFNTIFENMKKQLLLIGILVGALQLGFAQQARVVSAFNLLNSYNQTKDIDELRKAKENIDQATENAGTAAKQKTWFYRGNVYWAMHENKDASFTANGADPLMEAISAYQKAVELEPKGQFTDEARTKIEMGSNIMLNSGVKAFNEKDLNGALAYFEKSMQIKESMGVIDTVGLANAAMTSMAAKQYDKAIAYYGRINSFGNSKDGLTYLQLSRAHKAKGDTATSLKVIQEGRTKFPDDAALVTDELNIYLQGGKDKEAETMLKVAIEKDPNNHILHFASGTIYDKLGNRANALAAYQKAIEIKPDYFDAYYNLGAVYFNEGKRLQDIANNEKDNKKYEAGKKLADAEFEKALPVLEKALALLPDDVSTLQSLKQLYFRMGLTEKYNEVKKRLEP